MYDLMQMQQPTDGGISRPRRLALDLVQASLKVRAEVPARGGSEMAAGWSCLRWRSRARLGTGRSLRCSSQVTSRGERNPEARVGYGVKRASGGVAVRGQRTPMEGQQIERGFRAGTRPSAQSAGPPEARPRGHAELSGHKARAGQGEERKLLLEASVRFGLQNKAPARGDATAQSRTLPGLPALRKSPAARRPAALTPLAWPQSLREYGFAHCGGAAPQPSLLGGSSPPPCADWWRTEARLLIGQQRSHSGRLRWGGRPGVISWASDTPRRQQRAGALWRRRRWGGGSRCHVVAPLFRRLSTRALWEGVKGRAEDRAVPAASRETLAGLALLGPRTAVRQPRATAGFSFVPSPPLPTPSINIILLKILRCQAAKVESAIAEGGASRFSASSGGGGSRGAPQHYPKTAGNSEFLGKTPGQNAQKWIPARSTRRDDNSAANNSANEKERHDAIFRKVRGILNKLTPEKFDKLCLELLNVGVESKLILKGVILLIVDKALEEPKYSSLYAQLCLRLAEDAPNFDGPAAEGQPGQKQSTTFRRLLISKLQDEFENRTRNVDVYDKRENPLLPEEEEQRAIAKIKMLGNIKFIGELGKLDLIHESILHKCIKTLLEKKKRVQLKDMGEDLECLCQIMRTVGPRLDHERAKSLMDQYFARMCSLMLSKELPARIRFLLQDTVELREHHWVPRKAFLDNGPKTINQIRQDAVKDLGVFIPAPMAQGRNDFFLEGPFMPPRMKMDRDPLGGLADMFGQMPGSGIGTGPGVIQDRFSPTMGRHRSNQLFNGHGGHIMPPTQSQFGEMGGKFMKSQISLRPAQSFLMNKNQVPKLQPQITMIPPSAQPPRTQTPPLGQTPQLGLKTNPPLIQEKPAKTSKKPPPSKEELLKQTEAVVTEYLNSGNANEAVNGMREMRAPKHFLPEMLSKVIILSLDRSDEDKEKASSLISLLKQEGIATSDNFMQAFLNVLEQCPKLEVDIPLVKSYLAQFAARAIISELVSISELAQPLESGTHFPLFLLCLQQLAKLQDREWLTELFQQSKVNMQKMLPEIDQNKDRMLEILEGKGLSFLFPLLKLEKELLKQIKLDPSPQTIYKWIKDNISPKLHVDKGFVNILMTSFLQYISSEVSPPSDETDSSSAPSKEQLEQEKQLLLSFKPVMQKFLHDHVDLQVSALYALQVHCYNSSFPKGMLLRFFVHFYDMEIIEEEAFLAWKEDITQEFPGKGKALFQVNQWLTWLETAEEEESEEEAD
uniref:eukaryotic translation initiation factor 4 gamma 2 n=1 Tax=Myodes glareolus TaxID=447135 RepID=UPI00202092A6|nr:eukaryotic translation initiation factor 4 gamma 2 [Myodes glareolus]